MCTYVDNLTPPTNTQQIRKVIFFPLQQCLCRYNFTKFFSLLRDNLNKTKLSATFSRTYLPETVCHVWILVVLGVKPPKMSRTTGQHSSRGGLGMRRLEATYSSEDAILCRVWNRALSEDFWKLSHRQNSFMSKNPLIAPTRLLC